MSRTWQKDLKDARPMNQVIIDRYFKPSEYICYTTEKTGDKHLDWLDQERGIDLVVIYKYRNYVFGVALRAQSDGNNWESFTIRYDRIRTNTGKNTEYKKLFNALDKGLLMPLVIIQSYFDKDKKTIKSAALIYSELLLHFLKNKEDLVAQRSTGSEVFKIAWWCVLEENGYKIIRY